MLLLLKIQKKLAFDFCLRWCMRMSSMISMSSIGTFASSISAARGLPLPTRPLHLPAFSVPRFVESCNSGTVR